MGADITSKFLTGLFRQHMTIEAKRLIEPYMGRWMQVSGTLEDVGEVKDYGVLVHFQQPAESELVTMSFDKEWGDRLSILQKGSKITVIGQISEVRPIMLELSHCELVSD